MSMSPSLSLLIYSNESPLLGSGELIRKGALITKLSPKGKGALIRTNTVSLALQNVVNRENSVFRKF